MRELDSAAVQAGVAGGAILAGGGGGWVRHGYELGNLAVAYGSPRLVSLDELDGDDLVVVVSQIGAPAAPGAHMEPRDFIRALEMVMETAPGRVVGVMTAQNGSSTTVHGWLHAAVIRGLTVVDVAGNGRAHPTAKMGGMGLSADPNFVTVAAGVGGDRVKGRYVEAFARGSLAATSNIMRRAAVEAGGFVANARTPISVDFLRRKGAVGAISFALDLGRVVLAARADGGTAVIDALVDNLSARVLVTGMVEEFEIRTENGFDLGRAIVSDGRGTAIELRLCNEWMTAECDGERVASFPDVIHLLDTEGGLPVAAADVQKGQRLTAFAIPGDRLPLGAGVGDPSVYPEVEAMIGRDLLDYAMAAVSRNGRPRS
ncbi:MAG TPA: DUF917 family protein [Rhodothermales bacterium]